MSIPPTLHSDRVTLRLVTPDDADRLTGILTATAVAHWWPGYDEDRIRREYTHPDPGEKDGTMAFMVEADGETIGLIQCHEENEPDYRHAGIDIALHPDWHGRGLGPEAIRTLARWLFGERGHHRLTIDPAADNAAAIRSYAKVGFRPVGRMRQYERGADGTWHDGLLMDLLRDELT